MATLILWDIDEVESPIKPFFLYFSTTPYISVAVYISIGALLPSIRKDFGESIQVGHWKVHELGGEGVMRHLCGKSVRKGAPHT